MDRRTFIRNGFITGIGLPFALKNIGRNIFIPLRLPNTVDTWEKVGGPIGGLGYNVRFRPDDPDTFFVTDAWSGLQKSTNGGADWTIANNGITARGGASNDAIPVFAFRIDPNTPSTMWAGTEFGGGLFKSTDGGDTWEKKDTGINLDPNPDTAPLTIRHIEVKPGDSDTVYVMGENHTGIQGTEFERVKGFIYRSTNGGNSFALIREFDSLTRWLFFDSQNVNNMLLTTGIFDREADTDDPGAVHPSGPGLGVFRSTDGGDTWAASSTGMNAAKSLFIGGADVDPSNSSTIIVASGNNADFTKNIYGAVHRSTDGGATWTEVTPMVQIGLTYLEPFTAVAFAPSDPNVVYVGSADAIYRSSDNGLTWVRHAGANGAPYGPQGVRSGVPIDMVVSPTDPNLVYVNNYGGGVFRSTDGAQSWISWSRGYTGADIHAVAVNPWDADDILANGRSGVFSSADGGSNWDGISNGPASFPEGFGVAFDPNDGNGTTVFSSDELEGMLLRSTDKGQTWNSVLNLQVGEVGNRHGARNIVFAPSDPTIVYAGFMSAGFHSNPHDLTFGDSFGVYKSEDRGQTWNPINNGLPTGDRSRNVTDIAISAQDPDIVYITLRDGGIYKTIDGGTNWVDAKGNLPAGQSWDDVWEMEDPIPRRAALSVTVHPFNDDIIYLGTHIFGVYKTTDGGANWTQVLQPQQLANEGTSNHGHITSMVITPDDPSSIYAADWHGGVYRSTDDGATWALINTGLSTRAVAFMKMSADSQYVYAATQGEGVFRFQAKVVAVSTEEESSEIPNGIVLHQNYPNPFNPVTTIQFALVEPADVKLSIYDINGRLITTVLQNRLNQGSHSVQFNASALASGTYIYELRANNQVVSKKMTLIK